MAVAVEELRWSEGVHAPSPFSELLVDSLPDPADLACVDAGCGAGLVTVALLRRGAREVFAFDKDRYAVADARQNVARLAPDPQRARIRIGGFAELSGEPCDVLVCTHRSVRRRSGPTSSAPRNGRSSWPGTTGWEP